MVHERTGSHHVVDVSGVGDDLGLRQAYASFGWTKRVPIVKDLRLRIRPTA